MPNPKATASSIARKDAKRNRNTQQHADNLDRVAELGIPARESLHKKVIIDRAGKTVELTRTRNVRPSKLIRTHTRALNRKVQAKIDTAVAIEAKPE